MDVRADISTNTSACDPLISETVVEEGVEGMLKYIYIACRV